MSNHAVRLALSVGEPAGIGPDLVVLLQDRLPKHLRIFADKELLLQRAERLARPFTRLDQVEHIPLSATVFPGEIQTQHVSYVLACLQAATEACLQKRCKALITAPVHKGIIREAGYDFTGHTEWLQNYCKVPQVVMLLVHQQLRVALATTHLALQAVPAAINQELLTRVIRILHQDLQRYFGIQAPRIAVCGLNPHAGEQGHFGREEIDIILPALAACRANGWHVTGPIPADTAFIPNQLATCDAVLTLYHDQGLPVIKHASFGHAVNVSLGLPFLRTSVDHGTALALAGTANASPESLWAAIQLADQLC